VFGKRIARPASCPACGGEVWAPALKAYRYAGQVREHAGDVADCVACGCRCTLLREGGLVRFGGARPAAAERPEAAAPGGHGTGRAGWLDPDMVTLDTPAGGL
jgi:hypothetical protein